MALVLREKHVRMLLSMQDTVAVLEKAFNAQAQGMVINQPRNRLVLANGVLNILAAAAPTFGVLGYKTYTAFRDGVRFVVMLYSARDGRLQAIVEAEWLGAMRTGAVSALATKYLARPDARVVGLFGSGKQAVTQLMGVCAVLDIASIRVYSRDVQMCERFCREMAQVLGVEVIPVPTAREAVIDSDIIITATTAGEPVFQGEWLQPGCHINAIGSNWSRKREIDFTTLQRSSLVVTDSLEQAMEEAGDLIIPANEGLFDWNSVYELAEVISSERYDGPWRETPEDITLYKGLGIALEDVVTAAHVYHLACAQGLGEELNLLS
ncbi:ornithine cyclodeaminase family protein [Ktedonospora formicarum]|uniref:Ornithine cyclodeaminase n=1 Tax=Ktedonospora formicarum TaxID=2778364 RepID=A0A8J3HY38_9CHLR|nr:ornithine cyclodeaminase family protein [Ktedonospora formicarum]GHO42757.1 ornithine cyclodeaminase [Ktedonospora formicarum]